MRPVHEADTERKDKRLLVLLCLGVIFLAAQADLSSGTHQDHGWKWLEKGGEERVVYRIPSRKSEYARLSPRPAFLLGSPMSINQADKDALQLLPGIGPHLAGRIIDHRKAHGPLHSPSALRSIPGIGPRLSERLSTLVSFE